MYHTYDKHRFCQNCESPIEDTARSDKIFCDKSCKQVYHNRKSREKAQEIKAITAPYDRILWKNRQLLERFSTNRLQQMSMLERHGFNQEYLTRIIDRKSRRPIFVVHDYCYQYIGSYDYFDDDDMNYIKIMKSPEIDHLGNTIYPPLFSGSTD